MRTLPLILIFVAGCAGGPRYPINTAPVDVQNECSVQNPGYKKRAGEFYDRTHIRTGVAQLFSQCSVPWSKKSTAVNILRALSYDFLDEYVRRGGLMPPPARMNLIDVLDERFRLLLSAREYACYEQWRDGSREQNDLEFLTRRHPMQSDVQPARAEQDNSPHLYLVGDSGDTEIKIALGEKTIWEGIVEKRGWVPNVHSAPLSHSCGETCSLVLRGGPYQISKQVRWSDGESLIIHFSGNECALSQTREPVGFQ